MKNYEKLIALKEKVEDIVEEIRKETVCIQAENEDNLDILKKNVEADLKKIVSYCERLDIKDIRVKIPTMDGVYFTFDKDGYRIGQYQSGVGYTILDGYFQLDIFKGWNYGFVGHNNTHSQVVQKICEDWEHIVATIDNEIAARIKSICDRTMKKAMETLETAISNAKGSEEAVKKMSSAEISANMDFLSYEVLTDKSGHRFVSFSNEIYYNGNNNEAVNGYPCHYCYLSLDVPVDEIPSVTKDELMEMLSEAVRSMDDITEDAMTTLHKETSTLTKLNPLYVTADTADGVYWYEFE